MGTVGRRTVSLLLILVLWPAESRTPPPFTGASALSGLLAMTAGHSGSRLLLPN
jgi:hypothetical protein